MPFAKACSCRSRCARRLCQHRHIPRLDCLRHPVQQLCIRTHPVSQPQPGHAIIFGKGFQDKSCGASARDAVRLPPCPARSKKHSSKNRRIWCCWQNSRICSKSGGGTSRPVGLLGLHKNTTSGCFSRKSARNPHPIQSPPPAAGVALYLPAHMLKCGRILLKSRRQFYRFCACTALQ